MGPPVQGAEGRCQRARALSDIGSREVSTRSAVAFLWLLACKDRTPGRASRVAVHAGNRQKFIGIEACPADKGPIHILHCEEIPRVAWLDRAAIENPRIAAGFGKA